VILRRLPLSRAGRPPETAVLPTLPCRPRHGASAACGRGPAPTSRHAAAAVELAVVLPLLVFVFLLAVDFCRIFYATQIVQNCAYAGALYGSQAAASSASATTAAQQAAVAEGTNLTPPLAASQVTYTPPDSNNNIKVGVTYTFSTLAPFLGIPHSTTITRTVTMAAVPQ